MASCRACPSLAGAARRPARRCPTASHAGARPIRPGRSLRAPPTPAGCPAAGRRRRAPPRPPGRATRRPRSHLRETSPRSLGPAARRSPTAAQPSPSPPRQHSSRGRSAPSVGRGSHPRSGMPSQATVPDGSAQAQTRQAGSVAVPTARVTPDAAGGRGRGDSTQCLSPEVPRPAAPGRTRRPPTRSCRRGLSPSCRCRCR